MNKKVNSHALLFITINLPDIGQMLGVGEADIWFTLEKYRKKQYIK